MPTSTIPGMSEVLEIPCPGDHEHAHTCGSQTARSARYPQPMAQAFHELFSTTSICQNEEYRAAEILACRAPHQAAEATGKPAATLIVVPCASCPGGRNQEEQHLRCTTRTTPSLSSVVCCSAVRALAPEPQGLTCRREESFAGTRLSASE